MRFVTEERVTRNIEASHLSMAMGYHRGLTCSTTMRIHPQGWNDGIVRRNCSKRSSKRSSMRRSTRICRLQRRSRWRLVVEAELPMPCLRTGTLMKHSLECAAPECAARQAVW